VSLVLTFTPIVVGAAGIALLAEQPTATQWMGAALQVIGAGLYFAAADLSGGRTVGLVVVIAGLLANAASAVMGRSINRDGRLPALVVTTVSMGIGALPLLAVGVGAQGLPRLGSTQWIIVGWLAVVNTAVAFTLWNHTLRTLPAVESSVINNTMLIQIAVLAWIFLDERLTWWQGAGLGLASLGALAVTARPAPRTAHPARLAAGPAGACKERPRTG
jgi:drug/metabolite transporter (DMT)-like permease